MEFSDVTDSLRFLPTRKKQAVAALCLAEFCAANGIAHSAINELVAHLLSILTSVDLPEWEHQGSKLRLSGRGDPLPDSVAAVLPDCMSRVFAHLVECVVEVGLVDMYGGPTEEPSRFLLECIAILNSCGIRPFPIHELFALDESQQRDAFHWGDAVTAEEYEEVLSVYQAISTGPTGARHS